MPGQCRPRHHPWLRRSSARRECQGPPGSPGTRITGNKRPETLGACGNRCWQCVRRKRSGSPWQSGNGDIKRLAVIQGPATALTLPRVSSRDNGARCDALRIAEPASGPGYPAGTGLTNPVMMGSVHRAELDRLPIRRWRSPAGYGEDPSQTNRCPVPRFCPLPPSLRRQSDLSRRDGVRRTYTKQSCAPCQRSSALGDRRVRACAAR